MPVISPSSTDAGLTRSDGLPVAAGGNRGEPGFYYPTGVRNFVRLQAVDALEGTALAVLAKQLGLTRVYVLLEQGTFFEGQATEPFKRGAKALGVGLAGESSFKTATANPAALADVVARSHADGVVIGANAYPAGLPLVKALRARLGPRIPLLATGIGFDPPLPAAARGVYVASTDVPRSAAPLTTAGKRFARETGEGNKPQYGVLESAQAAQLVLSAIARSDGTRASVLRNLRASRVTNGILGSFRFDRNGDADPPVMPVERLAVTPARRADRRRGLRPPDHDPRAARAAVALLGHLVEEIERAGGLLELVRDRPIDHELNLHLVRARSSFVIFLCH